MSVIYIEKGNEDGVGEIEANNKKVHSFFFIENGGNLIRGDLGVGIFYVFSTTFLCKYKIVIQDLWIDFISIFRLHIFILYIYTLNSYEICSNSNLLLLFLLLLLFFIIFLFL